MSETRLAATARSTDQLGGPAALNRGTRATRARRSLAEFARQAIEAGVVEGIRQVQWGPHLDALCSQTQLQLEGWLVAYGLGSSDMAVRQRVAWERTGARWEDGAPNPWERYVLVQNHLDNLPPGTLKPCHVDGLVLERRRGVVRLGDVVVGDEVLTHKGRYRQVLATADQGVLPTLVIVTRYGRRIRVAGDHPVLTARGWVRADQVTTDDVLAEVNPHEPCGTRTVSLEEARALGYLIGDGHVKGAGTSFTNSDPEAIADFIACIKSIGLEARVCRTRPSKVPTRDVHIVSVTTLRSELCPCGAPRFPPHRRCKQCLHKRGYAKRKGMPVSDDNPSEAVVRWRKSRGLDGRCSYDKRVPAAIMAGDDEVVAEYLAAYWACDGGIYERTDLPKRSKAIRVDAVTVSEGLALDHQVLLQRLGLSFTLRRQNLKIVSKRQGATYVAFKLYAHDQDTVAKFMQVVGARMRHEKRHRVPWVQRQDFDQTLKPDPVVAIEPGEPGACRCLQIDEDSSFMYQGVAVHNSTLVMNCANAWIWLWCPWFAFAACSGIDANVKRDSDAARALVKSPWYRETFDIAWADQDVEPDLDEHDEETGITIRHDAASVSDWKTTVGGRRISRTVGRGFTGVHADGIFLDDPDDADKVWNETSRLRPQNRFTRAIRNRVNCDHRSIRKVMQQVVHVEGFSAYLLSLSRWSPQNPKGWARLCLPAEYGMGPEDSPEETPYGWRDWRKVKGEVLHPRLSPGVLADYRENMPGYEGQYNQNPDRAANGTLERRFARFFVFEEEQDRIATLRKRPLGCPERADQPPIVIRRAQLTKRTLSVDANNTLDLKPNAKPSAVGLTVDAMIDSNTFVLDDRTKVLDIAGTYLAIFEAMRAWPLDEILVELKAAGASVIQELRVAIRRGFYLDPVTDKRIELLGPDGRPARPEVRHITPNEDKAARNQGLVLPWQTGTIFLHDGASWLYAQADVNRKIVDEGFIGEVCSWPKSRRGDRLDSLSQYITRHRIVKPPPKGSVPPIEIELPAR